MSLTHWVEASLLGAHTGPTSHWVEDSSMGAYIGPTSHWVEDSSMGAHTRPTSHWVEDRLGLWRHTLEPRHTGLRMLNLLKRSAYTMSSLWWCHVLVSVLAYNILRISVLQLWERILAAVFYPELHHCIPHWLPYLLFPCITYAVTLNNVFWLSPHFSHSFCHIPYMELIGGIVIHRPRDFCCK